MKRKIRLLSLVIILCGAILPAQQLHAEEDTGDLYHVVDSADLLSDEEEEDLEIRIQEIADIYEFDVVIVTENDIGGEDATAYADDFFDYNGYGYGESKDGMLFLVSMDESSWAISTHGYGETAFTKYGTDYIGEKAADYLSDGEYYNAFSNYVDNADMFLEQAATGVPYDDDNEVDESFSLLFSGFLALIAGLAAATIVTYLMKRAMKTARPQGLALEYVKENGFTVDRKQDLFLYSQTTSHKKEKSSSDSHTSSSGESHGGSSGKF